jgi:hypothetical protein
MTSLVGILCKDGVVIGADSAVSLEDGRVRTIEQQYDKIEIIGNSVILVGTGAVGLGQRFSAIVNDEWNHKKTFFQNTPLNIAKILCGAALNDFRSTFAPPGLGALVAFPVGGKAHLFEFGIRDFQPEMKTEKLWFTSLGCVQIITDSFLAYLKSVFWNDELPNVNDGIFIVKWTLEHAVAVNPGGVNAPVRVAVLEQVGGKYIARMVSDDELQEHQQNIEGAKKALMEYRNQYKSLEGVPTPSIPQPMVKEGNLGQTSRVASTEPEELIKLISKTSMYGTEKLAQQQPEAEEIQSKGRKRHQK